MFRADDAANRTFNCDETGFSTDPNKKKQFFSKSAIDSYLLTPTCGKAMHSVLVCGSAAGDFMRPCVLYKSKEIHDSWANGGPSGCSFRNTDSGWMSGDVSESWLRKGFIPHVSSLHKPVFLFFDGHGSHLTYAAVKAAMDDIIMVCLPPHTSHALQPLDVTVFKLLKDKWCTNLLRFYRETRMKSVDKGSFPLLLKQLWEKKSASHLVGGFRGSSLWPFNPNAIRDPKNVQDHVSVSSEPQPGPSSQERRRVCG